MRPMAPVVEVAYLLNFVSTGPIRLCMLPKLKLEPSNAETLSAVTKNGLARAVVGTHLVELLPLTPEVCSSNPVVDKIYIEHLCTVNCIEKTIIKKKETINGIFKNGSLR